MKTESPGGKAGTLGQSLLWKLGSATLTIATLIIFLILVLTRGALLGRVLPSLARLTCLAGLSAVLAGLTGLAALLPLSVLPTLLTLFLHIVCHEVFLLKTPACGVF
jgi:hypothetical protein